MGEQSQSFPIVGVGASAGGLEAFTQMLRALPVDTGMAFVLVQHLDPTHASMLTEILSRATRMPVSEIQNQMPVEPNHVYVIPPRTDMAIAQGVLQLSPRKEARGQHRPIDHFLLSLAEDQGHTAIGVILSGSATDGTLGLEAIKAEGGIAFAQDDTAQYNSMPRSAVAAGCVDFVLPPGEIAKEIERIGRHPYVAPAPAAKPEEPAREPNLGTVLELLRHTSGVDFTQYKFNTLYRRITRRMVLHKVEGLNDYVRLLQTSPPETEALYQDLLINVTSFFRNPETFEVLKSHVFPKLTQDRGRHEPVRIWVPGCSTGEEAYSIAMVLAEFLEASGRNIPAQIFATDLNSVSVEKARTGIYSKNIANDVSPERLRRFFAEVDDSYRISKTIRDMCVFARHNALADPPFSRVDLVSCRNLLIYLEPPAQQKLVPILHYALKPNGFLCLGTSETIGSYRDLFEVEDSKYRIYAKKPGESRVTAGVHLGEYAAPRGMAQKPGPLREIGLSALDAQKEADRAMLARYAPPGVLVNGDLEILQFRGDTGRYLAPAPGKASLNLLKMLRPGLLVAVRGAVHKAKREEVPVREEGLLVKTNGGNLDVHVEVIPVKANSKAGGYFLVLFEEPALAPRAPLGQESQGTGKAGGRAAAVAPPGEQEAAEREIAQLKQELAATREYLQSVIEQQEAANEELQSANEEVQSTNEELQSINEELETSKEEIQSSNEELATVNDEMHNRNLELSQSNNDFINLFSSAQMAIVMLGPDLRIRRFTPMAEKLFNLIATDVGRPISDIAHNIGVSNLEQLVTEMIDTVGVKEHEVQDRQGRWYSLRIRPYKTLESKIEGAVLALVDVDGLKRGQDRLRRQAELLDQAHEPIFVWEFDGPITYWNRGAEQVYGITKEQAIGRIPHELLSISVPYRTFREALERKGHWSGELTQMQADGKSVVMESRMVLLREADGNRLVFETNFPITERKQMEEALRQRAEDLIAADRRKNEFLAMLAHELRNPLAPIRNAVHLLKESGADRAVGTQALDMLDRQVHAMSRMIDDLLDVSRVSQGRIDLRKAPVELATIVTRAMESVRLQVEERRQEVSLSLPPHPVSLEADAVRLEQVLGNLLHNASKFAPPGGHIWLTAGREGAEGVVVRVRDDGTGIAQDMLQHIFEPFVQLERSPARTHGSLGIGLTLVKRLVELHGGSVEAHSAGPGQGSEFVVRLPSLSLPGAAPGVAQATPQQEVSPRAAEPRRILVVDDNVDAAESVAMVLRLAGHDVRVAHEGPDVPNVATTFRPQVVLLDIGLPGMDGYEVARRLRQQPELGGVTLVAVTGYGRDEDRRLAQEAGFDHHLTKPVDPNVLHELLASLPSPSA